MGPTTLLLLLSLPVLAGGPVVALDPGHGGEDLGQHIHGVQERHFALDLASRTAAALTARGLTPFLTRFNDEFVPLSDRVLRAEQVGAKAFLSIHADNNTLRSGKGVVLWVYGENKRIPPGPPRRPGERLLPPPPKEQTAASRLLAERIQGRLRKRGIRTPHYVDRGPFAVLKGPAMASVLVEAANLRDKKEAAQLKDPAFLDRLAAALAEACAEHLKTRD